MFFYFAFLFLSFLALKEFLKKKNAQKNVEKVAIDINVVLKGQEFLFMKSVFVHDYDQTYHLRNGRVNSAKF